MSESQQPTHQGPPPSVPAQPAPPQAGPMASSASSTSAPSTRSGPSGPTSVSGASGPSAGPLDPATVEESLRRKLLMGAALLLAITSIYAGVFNVGRLAQIVLAAGATMAVVLALTSGSRRRNS